MKHLIFLILILVLNDDLLCQQNVKGKILEEQTGNPLPNANIITSDGLQGTVSNLNGEFELDNIKDSTIIVSYVGYETKEIQITPKNEILNIYLQQKIISSQSVLVTGSLGTKGITPIVLEKVDKEEIQKTYSVQDIPQFLSNQPSIMSYSESGNGIGYNYLSIRGFDQRRISVSINGIPQNDPEDHNVYWLDFPDLLANTEMIQVQRGAGSGVFGYPAIGGSVNIITASISKSPGLKLETYFGTYDTKKYSASFSSGLVDDKYSLSASFSRITSSGYRDLSWVKYNAYSFSAVRYDKDFTTQFNLYGGPIEDGLAYYGLPKFKLLDRDARKKNYSYWEADYNADTITYSLARRSEEIENFSQPHFELLNELKISSNLILNSALFMVIGNGFFDYDASWADTNYFRLNNWNGFNPTQNPGNALIRANVENAQYGWIPRLSLVHNNGELIVGGELRIHRSEHWGSINYAENLPAGVTKEYHYYFYNGAKDMFGGFVQESYRASEKLNLLGEVQIVYNKYRLYNELYQQNDFSVKHLFVNPRVGINYKLTDNQNIYISFARVSREPRLKNYYDAAESSGGEVPLFEKDESGNYDFSKPFVKPETMNDIEIGSSFSSRNANISLNLFYMSFDDEIVKNGKLDRFGQPVTGNAKRTLHQGVELSAAVNIFNRFSIWGNAAYSKNVIKEAEYYLSENESIDLSGNRISGFPDFIANIALKYEYSGVRLEFITKYVDRFYSDNYDNKLIEYLSKYPGFVTYDDNVNDSYFTSDLTGSYEFFLFNSALPSKIYLKVNNLFDNLYSAYAIGDQFFPAAERFFIAGIQLGL